MEESVVEQFCAKYESLSGHWHLCGTEADASHRIVEIAKELSSKRVALGEIGESLKALVESGLAEAEIEAYGPPFKGEELPHSIDQAELGVSEAAFAIAESGTLIEFATNDAFRLVSTLPRVHIGVFRSETLVQTLKESASPIRTFFESNPESATVTFISGPSRTADIEMKLTLGVHGPEVAHAIVLG
jgi:L-lactate dehydrogenase complex protein LldG